MDFINEAKVIMIRHSLDKFIEILLDYWEKNPPTLGHGFSHELKVAVSAYNLGEMNGFDHPEDLFVGGLFHDIYRPAEDKGGMKTKLEVQK